MSLKVNVGNKTITGFWATISIIAVMPTVIGVCIVALVGILPVLPIFFLAHTFGKEQKNG